VPSENPVHLTRGHRESEHDRRMIAIGLLFVRMLCDCFKSRRRLEAEIVVLRHQLNILQQRMPRRVYLRWADRAVFRWLSLWPQCHTGKGFFSVCLTGI
jgi:hypothetical protein